MATREEKIGDVGRMARRAADVGRPDPGDDEHPHVGAPAISGASGDGACGGGSRRMRAYNTTQLNANTTLDASTAAAAPLAPHCQPSTIASGRSTAVSMPWVQIRRFGRPTVTANDFDQPTMNWIAPATTMIR